MRILTWSKVFKNPHRRKEIRLCTSKWKLRRLQEWKEQRRISEMPSRIFPRTWINSNLKAMKTIPWTLYLKNKRQRRNTLKLREDSKLTTRIVSWTAHMEHRGLSTSVINSSAWFHSKPRCTRTSITSSRWKSSSTISRIRSRHRKQVSHL